MLEKSKIKFLEISNEENETKKFDIIKSKEKIGEFEINILNIEKESNVLYNLSEPKYLQEVLERILKYGFNELNLKSMMFKLNNVEEIEVIEKIGLKKKDSNSENSLLYIMNNEFWRELRNREIDFFAYINMYSV